MPASNGEKSPASHDAGLPFGIKRREVEKRCFRKPMLSIVTISDNFEQFMTELKTKIDKFVNDG